MGRIPDQTIDEIRNRIDIVGLIGRYVDLKQAGRNHKGRCPFHDEKTPSFNVNPDRQIFHCFGCQVGGDAISFLMRHDSLTFPEAARTLAKEAGIEIPEDQSGERGISERLFAANDVAQNFFRSGLSAPEGAPAREYLEGRSLDADALSRFGIGFAPNSWDGLRKELAKHEIPEDIAVSAGLLIEKDRSKRYDRFRGRVTFPIHDVRGRIVGFGGRAIFADQEPKYLNSPESPIFHKRHALYGFPHALEGIRKADRAIICEGYFDRIALDLAGVLEGLATCGTALTQGHGEQLSRRVKQVVLLFDGDSAGRAAVGKALEVLLPIGLRIRAALLPPGEDPDSYLAAHGADALRSLVDRAPDAIEIVMGEALKQGFSTPAEKAAAVSQVAHYVALIRDPIERTEYARRLALVTDTQEAAVAAVVRRAASSPSSSGTSVSERGAAPAQAPASARPQQEGREERHLHRLAQVLYHFPTLLSDTTLERIDALVPQGSWKSIIDLLGDAVANEQLDDAGAIDLYRLESRLDAESSARLHSIAVDDLFDAVDGEESRVEIDAGAMLEDILGWFEKQQRTAAHESTTRQLRDPQADVEALLAEKQRQLEKRRAAHRVVNQRIQ